MGTPAFRKANERMLTAHYYLVCGDNNKSAFIRNIVEYNKHLIKAGAPAHLRVANGSTDQHAVEVFVRRSLKEWCVS
jgi:hypothetical protein